MKALINPQQSAQLLSSKRSANICCWMFYNPIRKTDVLQTQQQQMRTEGQTQSTSIFLFYFLFFHSCLHTYFCIYMCLSKKDYSWLAGVTWFQKHHINKKSVFPFFGWGERIKRNRVNTGRSLLGLVNILLKSACRQRSRAVQDFGI